MTLELNDPFDVMLFISPNCKWCKITENVLVKTAKAFGIDINLQKVDVTEKPDIAERYNIFSTPSLILYDRTAIVGALPQDAAKKVIQHLIHYKKK